MANKNVNAVSLPSRGTGLSMWSGILSAPEADQVCAISAFWGLDHTHWNCHTNAFCGELTGGLISRKAVLGVWKILFVPDVSRSGLTNISVVVRVVRMERYNNDPLISVR